MAAEIAAMPARIASRLACARVPASTATKAATPEVTPFAAVVDSSDAETASTAAAAATPPAPAACTHIRTRSEDGALSCAISHSTNKAPPADAVTAMRVAACHDAHPARKPYAAIARAVAGATSHSLRRTVASTASRSASVAATAAVMPAAGRPSMYDHALASTVTAAAWANAPAG